MITRQLFVSSISFKISTILLFVGFVFHIIGISITRWTSVTMSYSEYKYLRMTITYHVGLWKHCVCTNEALEHCTCFGDPEKEPAWLGTVRGMVILGLIGWFITGIICLIIACCKQTRTLKKVNIFSTLCSGVSIVIGLIIFGDGNNKDSHEFFDTFYNLDPVDTRGRLDTAFYLCAVAAIIALIPCLSLFIFDLRTETPAPTERQQEMVTSPIQFSNQGQIITAPWNQVQVIANVADHPPATRPVPEYEQNTLPPAYSSQAPEGHYMIYTQHTVDGIPYKG